MTPAPALYDLVRIGEIIEISADHKAVRVETGGMESVWVAWASTRAGDTRVWLPPAVGEQVVLLCPDGDFHGAIPLVSLFSDAYPAPGGSAPRIIFADGAQIYYDAAAHILTAILPAGGRVEVTAPGGITIDGDVQVNGTLTATQDVRAGEISLKTHRHSGVQVGGGNTGAPQ